MVESCCHPWYLLWKSDTFPSAFDMMGRPNSIYASTSRGQMGQSTTSVWNSSLINWTLPEFSAGDMPGCHCKEDHEKYPARHQSERLTFDPLSTVQPCHITMSNANRQTSATNIFNDLIAWRRDLWPGFIKRFAKPEGSGPLWAFPASEGTNRFDCICQFNRIPSDTESALESSWPVFRVVKILFSISVIFLSIFLEAQPAFVCICFGPALTLQYFWLSSVYFLAHNIAYILGERFWRPGALF